MTPYAPCHCSKSHVRPITCNMLTISASFFRCFWYCSQRQCQKEVPKKCDQCKQPKPRRDFDYRGSGKHKLSRCHQCRFPKCTRCGSLPQKPVAERSKKNASVMCPVHDSKRCACIRGYFQTKKHCGMALLRLSVSCIHQMHEATASVRNTLATTMGSAVL